MKKRVQEADSDVPGLQAELSGVKAEPSEWASPARHKLLSSTVNKIQQAEGLQQVVKQNSSKVISQ